MFVDEGGKTRHEYFLAARDTQILKGCYGENGDYRSCNDQYCKFFSTCKKYTENIQMGIDAEVERMKQAVDTTIKIKPGIEQPQEIEDMFQSLKTLDDERLMIRNARDESLNDQKLLKLMKARDKLDARIEQTKIALGINELTNGIQEIENEQHNLLGMIGEAVNSETWGQDSFKKTADAISSKDGEIVIVRSKRTDKSIIASKFFELHPIELQKLFNENAIKITQKDANKVLSKTEVDEICTAITTYTYDFRIKDGRMTDPTWQQ